MAKNLSNAGRKRIPMTSKMGNKNFYKGKGATKEGRLNSKGIVAADRLMRFSSGTKAGSVDPPGL